MEKYYKDSKTGIMYEIVGDFYYPCLVCEREMGVGRYGRLRANYLKEKHKVLYYNLLTVGKLEKHLKDIDILAYEIKERLIKDMANSQGITEQLKATDILKWVGMMNNISACVDEIVLRNIVYS